MRIEPRTLGQEVTPGREAHSGWKASTVVWETTLGARPWEQPLWS